MLIDGQRVGFTRLMRAIGSVTASAPMYPATEEQIRQIANAKGIDVRIIGITVREKKFAPKNIENFKKFAVQYIDSATASAKQ